MKRKVCLISNAHIDPIWQWEWEEGASAALSTFQSAVNLFNEHNYVFNHNEVSLYKYTEKYAPELFKEIQKHVAKGDWNIMGGWYLQPDVLMPEGEGIVRQIQEGKIYFMEKFGKWSKTAVNFDSFGHSRGLVQILRKCGQENYVFTRPYNDFVDPPKYQMVLPYEQFIWEGYDGSRVKANRSSGYGTLLGDAKNKVLRDLKHYENYENVFIPWGVGNHGGGPSRKDLNDLQELIDSKGDDAFVHATPDQFFESISPKDVISSSLIQCMPGCYTSIVEVKQNYRNLEKSLFFTEKMCSAASLAGAMDYPEKDLHEVVESMLNVQFHDVLPGSCVKAGEDCAINFMKHGLHILNQQRAQAFFGMIKGERPADPETYPIFVFNPKPYSSEQLVEAEMCLVMPRDFDHDHNYAVIDVYDENGNKMVSQTIKEESTIMYQWRKRVIFKANLRPLGMTRFTATWHSIPLTDIVKPVNQDIHFENGSKSVTIKADTGLIESYVVDGKELANGYLFEPYMYEDYEDPWGMNHKFIGWDPKPFQQMKNMRGVFDKLQSFEVVEDGDIYLAAESFFELEDSRVHILYKIYKEGDAIDVDVDLFPGDINKAFKLHLPLKGKEFSGEQMFGYEGLYENGDECIAHNYLTLKEEDGRFVEIVTPTSFASSYKDGVIHITLLRSATYCAHPTWLPKLVPDNMYLKKIDSGKRSYSFRLTMSNESELKKKAMAFVEKPYALNAFPTIDKRSGEPLGISLSNENIHMVTMKKGQQVDGYVIRLENNSSLNQTTILNVGKKSIELSFGKYEVKTIVFNDGLTESKEMVI